ncbi:MAG: hypothetical protein KC620_13620, partial [Myxococcales bacterium]|nr:hypothetical protein [Myxococcales bacterium]
GDALVGALTGYESTKRSSASSEGRRLFDDSLTSADEDFDGGDGGSGSDLGVGIRARAPRLAVQVRRKRGWGIGINLQQTLALRAAAATAVWFFDVNPVEPDDVLAATADGLLRSRDGGATWPLVLTGPTPPERIINHIARDPKDPTRLFVGTGRGMHVSRDGGETFDRIEHPFIVTSDVRWIDIDPARPEVLYVGATWGLLRSTDGGLNFSIAFLNPWPPLSLVRQVMVDPHRPERIWLATADGLMVRDGEKAEFDRAGGLLFVGTNVRCLSTDDTPGHLIAVTDTDVWETRDDGKHWQIGWFGPGQWKIAYAMFARGAPETVMVLTEAEVLRVGPLSRTARRRVARAQVDALQARFAEEPPIEEILRVALRRAGLYRPELAARRARARFAGLLPQISTGVAWMPYSPDRDFTNDVMPDEPRLRDPRSGTFSWAATAQWDLQGLVFQRAEAPIARVGRTNLDAERNLRSTVINLFQERRRLLLEAALSDDDARMALLRGLRIEELTAHLNTLTGGLFPPAPAL